MVDTTFLLGAGINRAVSSTDGLKPPLARDFFRQALRQPRLAAEYSQHSLSPLLDLIQKYWRLDRSQLLETDFDLEECYTFIELQRREAYFREDSDSLAQASRIQSLLTGLLLDYLSEFELWLFDTSTATTGTPSTFQEFGRLIYRTRSGVLTFNYDTLLESAIENASPRNQEADNALIRRESSAALRQQGLSEEDIFDKTYNYNEIFDEDVSFSHRQWNPFLAYKVRFDEVALHTPQ